MTAIGMEQFPLAEVYEPIKNLHSVLLNKQEMYRISATLPGGDHGFQSCFTPTNDLDQRERVIEARRIACAQTAGCLLSDIIIEPVPPLEVYNMLVQYAAWVTHGAYSVW